MVYLLIVFVWESFINFWVVRFGNGVFFSFVFYVFFEEIEI